MSEVYLGGNDGIIQYGFGLQGMETGRSPLSNPTSHFPK